MSDIVAFLEARLAERMYAAEAADRTGHWQDLAWPRSRGITGVAEEHILAQSPKFVLADVAAKRRLIEVEFAYAAKIDGEWGCGHSPTEIRDGKCSTSPATHPEAFPILCALAAAYAEHPDYDPDWSEPHRSEGP